MVNKTYQPINLCDSSDGSDSSDNFYCFEAPKIKLWLNLKKISFWWNSKTQMVMKLQKPNLWWNSKTQIVIKFNNSNSDETQQLKLWWNFKLKLWWKAKIQLVIKPLNSNCNETQILNCDVTKTKIVMKLKNSFFVETQKF